MLKYSRHNIFSQIRDSGNWFILNLLTGNADILTPEDAANVSLIRESKHCEDKDLYDQMTEKGYLIGEEEEKRLYNSKYLDFIDSRETDEIQLFFVTNYSCNFACSYCYQDQYDNPLEAIRRDVVDAFLDYVCSEFAGRKKYITVFGGEPLLPGKNHKDLISYLLRQASIRNLPVCIVTNGYTLEDYIPVLLEGNIREIQVTLDGTAEVHNRRRFLKGGSGTFERIVKGIDACLADKLPVNLRMVADRENTGNLPELASFAIGKGWTSNPLFKTQIGRNYELHHCQADAEKLFTRVSLYEKIYELTRDNPHILEFFKPAYSVTRFLAENGNLPEPLFDACPATKTEWAFDYTGNIYPCTATVGKKDESLGTFFPVRTIDLEKTGTWQARDVTSISGCSNCSLQLACGGGCGSVAGNHTGNICSADCRPVKELLELGFSAYFRQ
jgi:uncharacterized protein